MVIAKKARGQWRGPAPELVHRRARLDDPLGIPQGTGFEVADIAGKLLRRWSETFAVDKSFKV